MATRARHRPPPEEPAFTSSPERYILRVSRRDGEEVAGPIDPEELLVHHHRDNHPVEVAAQFLVRVPEPGQGLVALAGVLAGLTAGSVALGAGAGQFGLQAVAVLAQPVEVVGHRGSPFGSGEPWCSTPRRGSPAPRWRR